MKTIKQVIIEPVYVEFVPEHLEQNKLYISKLYSVAVHACLCGCNRKTVTPLNISGWVLDDSNGKATLSPSIGNYQFECKSHYIITDNKANFI